VEVKLIRGMKLGTNGQTREVAYLLQFLKRK